jgi:hypothetical protein
LASRAHIAWPACSPVFNSDRGRAAKFADQATVGSANFTTQTGAERIIRSSDSADPKNQKNERKKSHGGRLLDSQGRGNAMGSELADADGHAGQDQVPSRSGTSKRGQTATAELLAHDQPQVHSQTELAQGASGSIGACSFGRLLRDYPHPPGPHGLEHGAYRGHARGVWNKLTIEQRQASVRAAGSAPGKDWLGHWLDEGRETGNFEVMKQRIPESRVWVRQGTPAWEAWEECYGANGRRVQTTQHRIDGELQTGWFFESEWPPGYEELIGRTGAAR